MGVSKRQLQVARLIEEELNAYFVKNRLTMIHGGMVSISKVYITPDLLECRISLSLFQISDTKAILTLFREKSNEMRRDIGNQLRNQLRRIPTLDFNLDDTLDYVEKIDQLFTQINEDDERMAAEHKNNNVDSDNTAATE